MARLAAEMSSVLSNLNVSEASGAPTAAATSAAPEDMAKMTKELDDFTAAMEKEGVNPEDLLKVILGDTAGLGAPKATGSAAGTKSQKSGGIKSKKKRGSGGAAKDAAKTESASGEKESFEETIRRTMERMQNSDSNATNAANNPAGGDEDMLASLLKAMEGEGGGGGDDDGLSKMFLGMMEQLTNKDMLYEPMKELDSKYPDWLAQNKGKLAEAEYKRFEGQRTVVREIVGKFEEKGYSDDDSACREFIWEHMQTMQSMGSPPEDLIANPFPGMMGGGGAGAGGLPGLGGAEGDEDAGCPTQ